MRGANGFVILHDEAGLELVVSRPIGKFGGGDAANARVNTYHIGLMQPAREKVDELFLSLSAAGAEVWSEPQAIRCRYRPQPPARRLFNPRCLPLRSRSRRPSLSGGQVAQLLRHQTRQSGPRLSKPCRRLCWLRTEILMHHRPETQHQPPRQRGCPRHRAPLPVPTPTCTRGVEDSGSNACLVT